MNCLLSAECDINTFASVFVLLIHLEPNDKVMASCNREHLLDQAL